MSAIKGLSEKNRNLLFELVKEIKAEGYAEGFEAGKSAVESVEEKSPQVAGTTSEEKEFWLYRRFEVTNEQLLEAAESLIKRKDIGREDLMVLLNTFQIRNT